MRYLQLALIVLLIAVVAPCALWRDLWHAAPALATLPPVPTARERQFGGQMTDETFAALEKTLPADFQPKKPNLYYLIDAMEDATGTTIFYNASLKKIGYPPDTPVTQSFGGKKLGDALLELVAWLNSDGGAKVTCVADDDETRVYLTPDDGGLTFAAVASYPVHSMIGFTSTTQAQADLIAEITSVVEPGQWNLKQPPNWQMQAMLGQLTVVAPPTRNLTSPAGLRC